MEKILYPKVKERIYSWETTKKKTQKYLLLVAFHVWALPRPCLDAGWGVAVRPKIPGTMQPDTLSLRVESAWAEGKAPYFGRQAIRKLWEVKWASSTVISIELMRNFSKSFLFRELIALWYSCHCRGVVHLPLLSWCSKWAGRKNHESGSATTTPGKALTGWNHLWW